MNHIHQKCKDKIGGKYMTATFEKTATNEGVLTFSIPQEEIQQGLTIAFNKLK